MLNVNFWNQNEKMFEIDLNSDLKENKVNMSPGFIKKTVTS